MAVTRVENSAWQPAAANLAQPYDRLATRAFRALQSLGRKLDATDPRLAREAAALLTSQLFFAPLLAEMRKLPFGKCFGHGGRMEDAFGEQLDTQIADTVARSDRGLTQKLADRLARRSPGASANDLTAQDTYCPTEVQAQAAAPRSVVAADPQAGRAKD
jgi:hypothetical protein